jgi:Holliday junction resolvasome RuvABC endonuclease subunit
MSTVRYILSLDVSICHTGWALYDRADGKFTYGVIEPPKTMIDFIPRMDFVRSEIISLLPGTVATWRDTVFVTIEGLAYAAKGNVGLQLAGVGYFVRHALWRAGIQYKEITPNQGKKWLTGKHLCEKNLILLKTFQKYGIECSDDNVADAINFNMIGRALQGWSVPENQGERDVLAQLTAGPKVKIKKGKKAAKTAVAA